MAYTKTIWVDGQIPAINAENLNNIENGIKDNESAISSIVLGENLKGEFTPSIAQEYPLTPSINDSWYISGLTGSGYDFTTGDLIGQTADNFDKLIYIATGWFLVEDTQNYVHNTGDESIGGIKTFTSSPVVPAGATGTQVPQSQEVVHSTGDESVAGIKTFTSSPIIPDPTTAQQPVSLNYLNNERKLYAAETVTVTFPSDADYTLTAEENSYGRILISGAVISTARNLTVNNIQKTLIVQNDEAFDITVKTLAGTGVIIHSGASVNVYNDGTNIINGITSVGVGINQTWQDLTASRSIGVTYTNTTDVPIFVSIMTANAAVNSLTVGGVIVSTTNSSGRDNLTSIIPVGATYIVSGGTLLLWAELRA